MCFGKHSFSPEMTSVTNSSGLNYQNGINPLGRKVRALESDVATLKTELALLKGGPIQASNSGTSISASASASASPAILAELDALRKELMTMKLAGYGKGEKGDKGDKGEKGDKGDPGPMTYIAMPANTVPSVPVATPAV